MGLAATLPRGGHYVSSGRVSPVVVDFFPVPLTHTPQSGIGGASFLAAGFFAPCGPVPNTNASCFGLVGASIMAAGGLRCPVPNTHASFFGVIAASVVPAYFNRGSVLPTHSSTVETI